MSPNVNNVRCRIQYQTKFRTFIFRRSYSIWIFYNPSLLIKFIVSISAEPCEKSRRIPQLLEERWVNETAHVALQYTHAAKLTHSPRLHILSYWRTQKAIPIVLISQQHLTRYGSVSFGLHCNVCRTVAAFSSSWKAFSSSSPKPDFRGYSRIKIPRNNYQHKSERIAVKCAPHLKMSNVKIKLLQHEIRGL